MKYLVLSVLMIPSYSYCQKLTPFNEALGGCVMGVSEVIKKERPDIVMDHERSKIFKKECEILLNKSLAELNKMKEYAYMYGCGLGVGATIRTVKGKKEASRIFASDEYAQKEVAKHCN